MNVWWGQIPRPRDDHQPMDSACEPTDDGTGDVVDRLDLVSHCSETSGSGFLCSADGRPDNRAACKRTGPRASLTLRAKLRVERFLATFLGCVNRCTDDWRWRQHMEEAKIPGWGLW